MFILIILLSSHLLPLVPSLRKDDQIRRTQLEELNPDYAIVSEHITYQTRATTTAVTRHVHGKEYIRSHGHPKGGDLPYQVSFKTLLNEFEDMYGSFCSGTLIQLDKVLTAANCFIRTRTGMAALFAGKYANRFYDMNQIRITCGDVDTYRTGDSMTVSGGQWRHVKNFIYHTQYKIPYRNIAIVYPETPFVESFHVKPINFAKTHKDYIGECITAGYGVHCNIDTASSLQMLRLKLMVESKCDQIYNAKTHDLICIDIDDYQHYNDTYLDDSGGPLVCSHTGENNESLNLGILVGISGGIINEYPAIYTRVSSYTDFIQCNGIRNKASPVFDKRFKIEYFLLLHLVSRIDYSPGTLRHVFVFF